LLIDAKRTLSVWVQITKQKAAQIVKTFILGKYTPEADRLSIYFSYATCFHAPHSTIEKIDETCKVESELPKDENEPVYINCRCRSDNCNHHMNINHSWKEFKEPVEVLLFKFVSDFEQVQEPESFNLYKLIKIAVPILCAVVVVFVFVYKYHLRRKTPSTNGMNGTHGEQIPILPQNGNDSRIDVNQEFTIVSYETFWLFLK